MTASQPTETGKPFSFPSEPIKISADEIRSTLDWVAQQPNFPPKVSTAMFASLWFLKVSDFRSTEDKFLASQQFDHRLQDHRAILASLIAEGEAVLLGAKKIGMESTKLNFTIEDIEATLESLHTTFHCQHRAKNSPEIDSLIKGLFDGQTP